jgi:hypothetical protein
MCRIPCLLEMAMRFDGQRLLLAEHPVRVISFHVTSERRFSLEEP